MVYQSSFHLLIFLCWCAIFQRFFLCFKLKPQFKHRSQSQCVFFCCSQSRRPRKQECWSVVQSELKSQSEFTRNRYKLKELDGKLTSRACFFYLNTNVDLEGTSWLPNIFELNLAAACNVFDAVHVLCYQPLNWNFISPGKYDKKMFLLDARQYLPAAECQKLLDKGWRVQHIADYVRLRAIFTTGGWFCDLDQLWLNSDRLRRSPNAFGHLGSSVKVAKFRGEKKSWLIKYLRKQSEEIFFSVPLHFPAQSFLLDASHSLGLSIIFLGEGWPMAALKL